MSTENLAQFAAAAQANPALQAKIQAAQSSNASDIAEQLAALSIEAGFPITAEEFLAAGSSDELTTDQLDHVAGGMFGSNIAWINRFPKTPTEPRIKHIID